LEQPLRLVLVAFGLQQNEGFTQVDMSRLVGGHLSQNHPTAEEQQGGEDEEITIAAK
jgi:hypothetical protein